MSISTTKRYRLTLRSKAVTFLVAAGALAFFPLDHYLLRGEEVARGSVSLEESEVDSLTITRPGETHLLEIRTFRNGQVRMKRRIAYRLIAPSGQVVVDEGEITSRKTHFVRFTPDQPGTYLFEAHDRGLFGTSAHASVRVTVGDRRLIQWLPWY